MEQKQYQNFLVFWFSQSVSQLGSSMTSFALIIWAYQQTGAAITVSLMTFCTYLPYVIVSLFAGAFIDRHSKKRIMLTSDVGAALCSLAVLLLSVAGRLALWHIYLVNLIVGFMNSFQSPAQTVAVGLMLPKEQYAKASGLNSFSTSLLTVATPMLAAFVLSFAGLTGVLCFDFATFLFAFSVLLLRVRVPEGCRAQAPRTGLLTGCRQGLAFLRLHRGILLMIISMAVMNFLSRLTYENILSPMLLARSGQDEVVLGIVTGLLGFGGILGGLIVAFVRLPRSNVALIYLSAAASFLLGDMLMGLGQNVAIWSIAALAASAPLAFVTAGQNVLLYRWVPTDMQGRVFAVRNAIQYCTIPAGLLLGGLLADKVFEPFLQGGSDIALLLSRLVGAGAGSGMAVMFLCTGTLGFLTSLHWFQNREIRALDEIPVDIRAKI